MDLAEPIALEVAESFDPIDAALTKSESTFRSPRMFDHGMTNAEAGCVHWAPGKSLWVTSMTVAALISGPLYFTWGAFILFLVATATTVCLGHSLGMHRRLISKRSQQLLDSRIEGCDVPLQLSDQTEMMGDQKPMMRRHAPIKRGGQFGSGTFQTRRTELGKLDRVRLAGDHRFQDAPPAGADDVRDHRCQLDVGVLQRFLNTLNMLGNLAC